MDDGYIRKADAIDAATQDSTENRTHSFRAGQARSASRIQALEPADVVPVVRCRDCKYWDNGNLSFECPWDYGRHGSSDEDDFCSYGERREE